MIFNPEKIEKLEPFNKKDYWFTQPFYKGCEILVLSKEEKKMMELNKYPLQEVCGYKCQWFKSEIDLIELNKSLNGMFISSIKDFSELKHDSYIEIDLEYIKTEEVERLLSFLKLFIPEDLELFKITDLDDISSIKIHKIDKYGNNTRIDYMLKSWNYKPILVEASNKDESIKDLKTGTNEVHSNSMDNKLFLESHEWGLMNNNDWKAIEVNTPTFKGFKFKRIKPKPTKSKQLTKLNGEKVERLNKFFKLTLFQLDTILNTEQLIQSQQIVKENEVLEQVMLVFNPKDECFNVKHIKNGIIVDSVKGTNKYKLIEIYNHLIDTMEHNFIIERSHNE